MESKVGKKLINSVENCVDEFLLGFVASNNHLNLVKEHRIVVRCDYQQLVQNGQVTIICGGGSGHEPAFAGYVGEGMLTAAVAGPVFASPPVSAILNALRLVGQKSRNGSGCLVIIANYTGDKMNFGMAIEKAKSEGYKVESLVVGDDTALVSPDKSAGRRGLAGIMLAIKVAGALAEQQLSLNEMLPILQDLTLNLGTIGICLKECSIPGCSSSFVLNDCEMELGLGVHGEAGVSRIQLLQAKEAVNVMLSHLTNPKSATGLTLKSEDKVVLLINNLGATTTLEMGIVAMEAIQWLESQNLEVLRVFVGHLMTSLEMAGIGLTILNNAQQFIQYIDAETLAVGWPRPQHFKNTSCKNRLTSGLIKMDEVDTNICLLDHRLASEITLEHVQLLSECIGNICRRLLDVKETLNELDRNCGDGDCGNTLSSGADAILEALRLSTIDLKRPFNTFQQLSLICQQTMGGTSGAIFGIFLAAASVPLKSGLAIDSFTEAISAGFAAVSKHGGATPGDRTLLDSLYEVLNTLKNSKNSSLSELVNLVSSSAELGAKKTIGMKARAGRASYVPSVKQQQMDPGAKAIAIIAKAVSDVINHVQY
ncbi:hypothetical protein CHUAL_009652 [Chamberlinius hualienensis]